MAIQEQVYIGGPMRGLPRFGFDAFDSLAVWLRKNRKWNVFSPAEHDRETWPAIETWEGFADGDATLCPQFDLSQALSWDLARVAESQHLVLLPGWEQSTGARHERHVAELTGSSIWLAHELSIKGSIDPMWQLRLDMSREGSLQPTPTPVIERPLLSERYPEHFPNKAPDPGKAARRIMQAEYDLGHAFTTKDSGVRKAFDSGMVRDTDEGKPRYDLIPILPLRRLAELYARGAVKYGPSNWMKANSDEELQRFKASAFRHLVQALDGDRDEDHWSGAVFNVFACEWLEDKLATAPPITAQQIREQDAAVSASIGRMLEDAVTDGPMIVRPSSHGDGLG